MVWIFDWEKRRYTVFFGITGYTVFSLSVRSQIDKLWSGRLSGRLDLPVTGPGHYAHDAFVAGGLDPNDAMRAVLSGIVPQCGFPAIGPSDEGKESFWVGGDHVPVERFPRVGEALMLNVVFAVGGPVVRN